MKQSRKDLRWTNSGSEECFNERGTSYCSADGINEAPLGSARTSGLRTAWKAVLSLASERRISYPSYIGLRRTRQREIICDYGIRRCAVVESQK